MALRILMRAASGASIGLGHAVRTLAVAEELLALGAEPVVVVDDAATAEFLGPLGVDANARPGWLEEPWDAAWFDAYRDVSTELARLAERGVAAALVENRTAAREHARVLVYPSLHHTDDAWDREHATRSGAGWIPLRREVLEARAERRDVDLLVTFGGSDPLRSTERVLRLLERRDGERVVATIGPHMRARRAELERLARGAELVEPGRALPEWMARSRRAITALATTLNELAYHGVATAILANFADDAPIMAHYAAFGPHVPLGITGDLDDATLAKRLGAVRSLPPVARPAGLGTGARANAELLLSLVEA